mgnify:CR=1 FL=1
MANFFIVHHNGERRFVNLDWVEEIRDEGEHAMINFAFTRPNVHFQDYLRTDETFDEVLKKIWR